MPAISQKTIDEVKERVRIEDVVCDYVQLKKKGRNMMACCPFHNERTPSFCVSVNNNFFKCFGCGESGDAISFIEKIECVDFVDAIKILAKKYSIQIEEVDSNPNISNDYIRKESASIIMSQAKDFYIEKLMSDCGVKARDYLYSRGLSDDVIENFLIGYSLRERNSWYTYSSSIGCNIDLQYQIGLVVERNGFNHDYFRGRVMIPIQDVSGKIVAFAGRLIDESDGEAKYVNSIESFLYHKGNILYGLYQAKKSIRHLNKCYIVEGYFDVISMHQAGVGNTVSSSGTALTDEQCKLLHRFTSNVTIFYDGDEPGVKATERAIKKTLAAGFTVNVISLPNNDDPDSFIRTSGSEGIEDRLNAFETDFVTFIVNKRSLNTSNATITVKKQIIDEITEIISLIEDSVYRSMAIQRVKDLLSMPGDVSLNIKNSKTLVPPVLVSKDVIESYEEEVVRNLILYGDQQMSDNVSVSEYLLNEVSQIEFCNDKYRQVIDTYTLLLNEHNVVPVRSLVNNIDDENLKKMVIDMSTNKYDISEQWNVNKEQNNISNMVRRNVLMLKLRIIHKMLKNYITLLNNSTDEVFLEKTMDTINALKRQELLISKDLGLTSII